MIHEYALDPNVLNSWASNHRDYAEFIREYGLGTPRIISSFPRRKASKLRSYLMQFSPNEAQPLSAQRYTEMVQKIVESVIVRDVLENSPTDWAETAALENSRVPFGVILTSTDGLTGNSVKPTAIYDQNSIWSHPDQINVPRTNEGLITAFLNLVRLANSKIVIVDPFGWTDSAIRFIRLMLLAIKRNRVSGGFPSVTLFYKEKHGSGAGNGSPKAEYVRHRLLNDLKTDIPNLKLEVFELTEVEDGDVFHNRCILTELGGVMTGHGVSLSNDPSHTDEAILMKPGIYQKKWRQFVEANCYRVVSEAKG